MEKGISGVEEQYKFLFGFRVVLASPESHVGIGRDVEYVVLGLESHPWEVGGLGQ